MGYAFTSELRNCPEDICNQGGMLRYEKCRLYFFGSNVCDKQHNQMCRGLMFIFTGTQDKEG